MIDSRRAEIKSGDRQEEDFLDVLMSHKYAEAGEPISDYHIRGQVMAACAANLIESVLCVPCDIIVSQSVCPLSSMNRSFSTQDQVIAIRHCETPDMQDKLERFYFVWQCSVMNKTYYMHSITL